MPVHVVSIHDCHPGGDLAVDLRDVLEALGPAVAKYEWVATLLKCTGEKIQVLCDEVGAARGAGVRIPGAKLLELAEDAGVTSDVILFAYPTAGAGLTAKAHARLSFPATDAQILLEAVDGVFYVVAVKDPKLIERVRGRFDDVRDEEVEASW